MATTARRFDSGQIRKAEITPEGFLRAPAFLTRVGVFEYLDAAGRVTRELRRPEQVFDPESLRSFALLPVTDGHPEVGYVDASSARELQRGSIGENVEQDGDHVRALMMITDKALVAKVQSGEQAEISNGYTCVLVDGAGEWNGRPYDVEQTKIRGNHVAVVPRGRAGPAARVKLDAADAIALPRRDDEGAPAPHKETTMNKKIRIHGIEFEVPVAVADAIEAQAHADAEAFKVKLDAAAAAGTKAIADLAAAQARADAATAEVGKLKTDGAAVVASQPKLVADAIAVIDVARRAGVEVKVDALDLNAVRVAVSEKVLGIKLDGKSAEYVAASFDLAKKKVDDAPTGAGLLAVIEDRGGEHEDAECTAEESRKKMAARNADLWKTEKPEKKDKK